MHALFIVVDTATLYNTLLDQTTVNLNTVRHLKCTNDEIREVLDEQNAPTMSTF